MAKKRSDRTHLIYQLTNTATGETYIGLTVAVGRAYQRSVKARLKRHVTRATNQNMDWNLCNSIRQHGPHVFQWSILEKVRGKAAAHQYETKLIHLYKPSLNSTI